MSDLESRIRDTLRRHEDDAPAFLPSDARRIAGRTRRRQILNAAVVGVGALAIVIGLAAGVGELVRADRTPTPLDTPPPSSFSTETTRLVEDFLHARIEGAGAEQFVEIVPDWNMVGGVPLLYATTTGARYERSEFERVDAPKGWGQVKVRLFADGGQTVVEQLFSFPREAGPLRLEYHPTTSDAAPTTENGNAVAVPYSYFNGDVIVRAAHPWAESFAFDPGLVIDQNLDERLEMAGDPLPIGTGCKPSLAPEGADALARTIRSDPDFEATAPLSVQVGGLDAIRMDVTAVPGASACERYPAPMVLKPDDPSSWRGLALKQGSRMRLYLLDIPTGSSIRTLAIAIVAPEPRFEQVVEAAAPIVNSFEFHPGDGTG